MRDYLRYVKSYPQEPGLLCNPDNSMRRAGIFLTTSRTYVEPLIAVAINNPAHKKNDNFFSWHFYLLSWVPSQLTCITLSVSACCILLRIALRIWSRFSPSSLPAFEIKVETSLPTKAAVNSEVLGSRSWLTTCITYHSPLWPCSSCHCAICSSATETYARRHSPPF